VWSTLVPLVGVAGGLFVLWQAALRWWAFGTGEVRGLAVELRAAFRDALALGALDTTQLLTDDRQARLRDWHDLLHDRVLQARLGHLLNLAADPHQRTGAA